MMQHSIMFAWAIILGKLIMSSVQSLLHKSFCHSIEVVLRLHAWFVTVCDIL
jgi:hypothetical protein